MQSHTIPYWCNGSVVNEETMTEILYNSVLDKFETEEAIKAVKDIFQEGLARALHLYRMTAPLFVKAGLGVNDDLNGERPVSFRIKDMDGQEAEIVHSLAKWKRMMLGQYDVPVGEGIYTDMSAIRTEEHLDALHSLYVDQWDWEATIAQSDRTIEHLQQVVRKIYRAIRATEARLCERYPSLHPFLPEEIVFINSEELRQRYPELDAKAREREICRQYGAVFIDGIGGVLGDGTIHDGRAADYDDWRMNGDILIWYPILGQQVELSSMGIRVDEISLVEQLRERGQEERKNLFFHQLILTHKIPYSIGGGIGQSRLCMVLLHKAHVGEVQASIWPEGMRIECLKKGIELI